MPKFSQQELEEIRKNTEQIEEARKEKEAKKKKNKSSKKKASKKKKQKDYSLQERMVPLILLIVTLAISYLVVMLF